MWPYQTNRPAGGRHSFALLLSALGESSMATPQDWGLMVLCGQFDWYDGVVAPSLTERWCRPLGCTACKLPILPTETQTL